MAGTGAASCHSLERVVKSTYDAAAFLPIVRRMSDYPSGAFPMRPIPFPKEFHRRGFANYMENEASLRHSSEYLATLNLLSGGRTRWTYPLKTLLPAPRATPARKVIYTEYDLRPGAEPYDAAVDSTGMVWYSDHGALYLGRLNPKTGETKEWPMPVLKPSAPATGLFVHLVRQAEQHLDWQSLSGYDL